MPQLTECRYNSDNFDCLFVVDVVVVWATVGMKSDDVDNWVASRSLR